MATHATLSQPSALEEKLKNSSPGKTGMVVFGIIRSIAAAWVFTLPAAALLSGCLFWAFDKMVR
jgi:phosphate/sulfate permease